MSEVTRSQFTEGLKADMYAYGFEAYDQLESQHEKVFEVVGSSKAYEQSTNILHGGKVVQKPEGEKITFRNPLEGYTIVGKNDTYADGVEFTMEQVQDMTKDQIANIVLDYARKWGEKVAIAKEKYTARFFNEGGFTAGSDIFNNSITGVVNDTSGDFIYDGKPFFNLVGNLRPLYPGGTPTHYNSVSPLNLTQANLQLQYLLMTSTNNVDGTGDKIGLKPDVLLVPSALTFAADTILKSTSIDSTDNSGIINPVANIVQKLEWQYLEDTDAWFVGKLRKGLKFHNRMPLTFNFWEDPETGGYKASVMARWGAHVYDWRYWTAANVSTS